MTRDELEVFARQASVTPERLVAVARAICVADSAAPLPDAPIYLGTRTAKAWHGRVAMAVAAIIEARRGWLEHDDTEGVRRIQRAAVHTFLAELECDGKVIVDASVYYRVHALPAKYTDTNEHYWFQNDPVTSVTGITPTPQLTER